MPPIGKADHDIEYIEYDIKMKSRVKFISTKEQILMVVVTI